MNPYPSKNRGELARNPIVLKENPKSDDNNTVMKVLFMLSLFWCSLQAFAASDAGFNYSKFKRLSYSQKVELIKTYQRLAAKVDEQSQKSMKFKFSLNRSEAFLENLEIYARLTKQFFIAEAIAQNFDVNKKCAFAGWVANYESNGTCSLIKVKKDANYSQTGCAANQIKCNPMLFGSDGSKAFCADAYLPGNRGASYQCMQLSAGVKDQNKHMKDIIAKITADPQSFHQLVLVLQRLCLCEADGTPKNKYRDRIHKPESSSTCDGLIQQLRKLLNVKNDSEEKNPWFCTEASFEGKTIQKDLAGIKAIVDQLEDSKKYDETLKAVCAAPVVPASGPGVVLVSENPTSPGGITVGTDPGNPGTGASPTAIEVVCTEDGSCEEPATSETAVTLKLIAVPEVKTDAVDIQVTELLCNSLKTPDEFVSDHKGCTLTWEAKPALATALDNDVIWNSIPRGATEIAITITLSDGTKQEISTHTIPVLEESSTSDSAITSDAAIASPDAIDFGDDTVPPYQGGQFLNLPPPFMFILPGSM